MYLITNVVNTFEGNVSHYDEGETYYIPLNKISVDPQKRSRRLPPSYKDSSDYLQLRTSLIRYGQLHPITLNKSTGRLKLVCGFRRFTAAVELRWERIKATIICVPKEMEMFYELTENISRTALTSYEYYESIGRAKEIYEASVLSGKYENLRFFTLEIKKDGSEFGSDGLPKNQLLPTFVSFYHKECGLSKRALRNKVRIWNAINSKKFDNSTINLIKTGQIKQNELLEILRKSGIKKRQKANPKILGKMDKIHTFKKTGAKDSSLSLNSSKRIGIQDKTEPNTKKQEDSEDLDSFENAKNNKLSTNIEKAEKIYEASKNNPLIKKQWIKVKKQQISLDKGHKNTIKIEEVNKSIREGILSSFEVAGKSYHKKKRIPNEKTQENSNNGKKNNKEKDISYEIPLEDKCRSCSMAQLYVYKCNECGDIPNCPSCGTPMTKVVCDADFVKGQIKLRNPNFSKCKDSPDINDYEVLLLKEAS